MGPEDVAGEVGARAGRYLSSVPPSQHEPASMALRGWFVPWCRRHAIGLQAIGDPISWERFAYHLQAMPTRLGKPFNEHTLTRILGEVRKFIATVHPGFVPPREHSVAALAEHHAEQASSPSNAERLRRTLIPFAQWCADQGMPVEWLRDGTLRRYERHLAAAGLERSQQREATDNVTRFLHTIAPGLRRLEPPRRSPLSGDEAARAALFAGALGFRYESMVLWLVSKGPTQLRDMQHLMITNPARVTSRLHQAGWLTATVRNKEFATMSSLARAVYVEHGNLAAHCRAMVRQRTQPADVFTIMRRIHRDSSQLAVLKRLLEGHASIATMSAEMGGRGSRGLIAEAIHGLMVDGVVNLTGVLEGDNLAWVVPQVENFIVQTEGVIALLTGPAATVRQRLDFLSNQRAPAVIDWLQQSPHHRDSVARTLQQNGIRRTADELVASGLVTLSGNMVTVNPSLPDVLNQATAVAGIMAEHAAREVTLGLGWAFGLPGVLPLLIQLDRADGSTGRGEWVSLADVTEEGAGQPQSASSEWIEDE